MKIEQEWHKIKIVLPDHFPFGSVIDTFVVTGTDVLLAIRKFMC